MRALVRLAGVGIIGVVLYFYFVGQAHGIVLTLLLANLVGIAYAIGGSSDVLWAAPLLAAWVWRERRWSALALGLACAAKQLAWFAAPRR